MNAWCQIFLEEIQLAIGDFIYFVRSLHLKILCFSLNQSVTKYFAAKQTKNKHKKKSENMLTYAFFLWTLIKKRPKTL